MSHGISMQSIVYMNAYIYVYILENNNNVSYHIYNHVNIHQNQSYTVKYIFDISISLLALTKD